jgi:hypothetical protein
VKINIIIKENIMPFDLYFSTSITNKVIVVKSIGPLERVNIKEVKYSINSNM